MSETLASLRARQAYPSPFSVRWGGRDAWNYEPCDRDGFKNISLAGKTIAIRRHRVAGVCRARAIYLRCAAVTARWFNVPCCKVVDRDRRRGSSPMQEALARRYALYLARTGFGISTPDLALAAGVTKGYVSRLVRSIEDLRDEPRIDRDLQTMESSLGVATL